MTQPGTFFGELMDSIWKDKTMNYSDREDAWAENLEDVLLCLYEDEVGHCSLTYGHSGLHDVHERR